MEEGTRTKKKSSRVFGGLRQKRKGISRTGWGLIRESSTVGGVKRRDWEIEKAKRPMKREKG